MQPSAELTWFRKPGSGHPGTLNLCYNALDRHVIAGNAGLPLLAAGGSVLDVATVLERVSALAGVFRGLGVAPGEAVGIVLDDAADEVFALLAALRVGAVARVGDDAAGWVRLLVTSRADVDATASEGSGREDRVVRLLRGVTPVDPQWDLDWDLAFRAGREDPAPCVDVPADQPALVAGGVVVATIDAVGHDSRAGRVLGRLVAGRSLLEDA